MLQDSIHNHRKFDDIILALDLCDEKQKKKRFGEFNYKLQYVIKMYQNWSFNFKRIKI